MIKNQIKIDLSLCGSPLKCGLCLQICPQAVFRTFPSRVYKFRETPEEEFDLKATYWMACVGCGECVKICPKGAISITSNKVVQGGAGVG